MKMIMKYTPLWMVNMLLCSRLRQTFASQILSRVIHSKESCLWHTVHLNFRSPTLTLLPSRQKSSHNYPCVSMCLINYSPSTIKGVQTTQNS